jgi:hypothetical protein
LPCRLAHGRRQRNRRDPHRTRNRSRDRQSRDPSCSRTRRTPRAPPLRHRRNARVRRSCIRRSTADVATAIRCEHPHQRTACAESARRPRCVGCTSPRNPRSTRPYLLRTRTRETGELQTPRHPSTEKMPARRFPLQCNLRVSRWERHNCQYQRAMSSDKNHVSQACGHRGQDRGSASASSQFGTSPCRPRRNGKPRPAPYRRESNRPAAASAQLNCPTPTSAKSWGGERRRPLRQAGDDGRHQRNGQEQEPGPSGDPT